MKNLEKDITEKIKKLKDEQKQLESHLKSIKKFNYSEYLQTLHMCSFKLHAEKGAIGEYIYSNGYFEIIVTLETPGGFTEVSVVDTETDGEYVDDRLGPMSIEDFITFINNFNDKYQIQDFTSNTVVGNWSIKICGKAYSKDHFANLIKELSFSKIKDSITLTTNSL